MITFAKERDESSSSSFEKTDFDLDINEATTAVVTHKKLSSLKVESSMLNRDLETTTKQAQEPKLSATPISNLRR